MKVAICNLGRIVSGDWHNPFVPGDTIATEADRIVSVGTATAQAVESADVVIDAGGMKVIAGSVILEPGLKANDFKELAEKGVRIAKAGFGAVVTAYDYAPLVADAKAAGLITTCHTGGSSIPGSGAITGDHLLKIRPHVSFHINGGPTAMPDADFSRVILETEMALQVCTAGNLRTTLLCARLAQQHGAFDRFIIATDTPTGSGVMPLGMLYTIAHLSSLTDMSPEQFICAATGNNARVYQLNSGFLKPGSAADIVLLDGPDGGKQSTARN